MIGVRFTGDYVVAPKVVEDNGKTYRGRISQVHPYGCPEGDVWLAGQQLLGSNPMQYKNHRWVTILRNDENGYRNGYAQAGAIVVPDLEEFVQKVEPFEFAHRDADLYFEGAKP